VIFLRSLIYFVAMVATILVFGLILATIGWVLPMSARESVSNAWADVNMWLLRVICRLDYRVEGAEHLPTTPSIVMAKHQSAWETISLRSIVRGNQSWVLKRELMWIPVFGWALAVSRPIAIDRKAGRRAIKQVVEQGIGHLKEEGRNVLIFPEGTRTAPGERGRYGIGGGMLAERAGVPVVPIAHNAGVFWKRRGILKHPGTITVVVGAPIETEGRKASQIIRDVEHWIEGQMARLPSA